MFSGTSRRDIRSPDCSAETMSNSSRLITHLRSSRVLESNIGVSYGKIGPPHYPTCRVPVANSCRRIWLRRSSGTVSLSTVMTIAGRRNDAPSRICVYAIRVCVCVYVRVHVAQRASWNYIDACRTLIHIASLLFRFSAFGYGYLGNRAAFDSSITCSRRRSLAKTLARSFLETTDLARSPGRRKSSLATPYNASIRSFRRMKRTKKIVVNAKITAAKLRVIHNARMFLWSTARVARGRNYYSEW